jgi:hypothetical protein
MSSHDDPSSTVIGRVLELLEAEFKHLRKERAALENVRAVITNRPLLPSKKVKIDVGGRIFCTTLHTLTQIPDCYFGTTFNDRWELELDDDGTFFIDRDPIVFSHILNFLRDYPHSTLDTKHFSPYELAMIKKEAEFYSIQPMVEILQSAYARPLVNAAKNIFADDESADFDMGDVSFSLFGDD